MKLPDQQKHRRDSPTVCTCLRISPVNSTIFLTNIWAPVAADPSYISNTRAYLPTSESTKPTGAHAGFHDFRHSTRFLSSNPRARTCVQKRVVSRSHIHTLLYSTRALQERGRKLMRTWFRTWRDKANRRWLSWTAASPKLQPTPLLTLERISLSLSLSLSFSRSRGVFIFWGTSCCCCCR